MLCCYFKWFVYNYRFLISSKKGSPTSEMFLYVYFNPYGPFNGETELYGSYLWSFNSVKYWSYIM